MLDSLEILTKACPALRIFITSRPEGTSIPEHAIQVRITVENELMRKAISARLQHYISSRTGSKSALARVCQDNESPAAITERIVQSAEGKFLFADLQYQGLEECDSEDEVFRRLENPIVKLGDLFEDAVARIQAQRKDKHQRIGMRALLWMLHAKRALSTRELSTALAMDDRKPDSMLE